MAKTRSRTAAAAEPIDREQSPLEINNAGEPARVAIDLIDVDVSTRPVDKTHAASLAKSIGSQGQQSPICLFRKGGGAGRYSLGFGHHRLEAHRLLGWTHINALVRPEAPLHQIRLAQAIENMQRHNLTPLEEATNAQIIVEAEGGDVDNAAALLGVETKWLERRMALNRLSPRVQQLLADGHIYLKHAELLARLVSHEKQEEIAGHYKGGPSKWNRKETRQPREMKEWKRAVEQELRSLVGVPWRKDVEFAGKPACDSCIHNSANAPGLFDGDQPRSAQCLNAACYSDKARASAAAVTKASNTLVEMKVTATPKHAAMAIEQRTQQASDNGKARVDFITPAAVVERVKRAAKPKRATTAERTGQERGQRDWEAEDKWRKAGDKWIDQAISAIDQSLSNDRHVCVWLLCRGFGRMWVTNDGHHNKPAMKKARARFDRLLMIAASLDLKKLAETFLEEEGLKGAFAGSNVTAWALQRMIQEFGVSFDDPIPRLEDFKPKPKAAAKEKAAVPMIAGRGKPRRATAVGGDRVKLSTLMNGHKKKRGSKKPAKSKRRKAVARG